MHSTVRTYNLLFSLFKENKISGISNYSVGGSPTVTGGPSFSVTRGFSPVPAWCTVGMQSAFWPIEWMARLEQLDCNIL